jgi:hypothetical protein
MDAFCKDLIRDRNITSASSVTIIHDNAKLLDRSLSDNLRSRRKTLAEEDDDSSEGEIVDSRWGNSSDKKMSVDGFLCPERQLSEREPASDRVPVGLHNDHQVGSSKGPLSLLLSEIVKVFHPQKEPAAAAITTRTNNNRNDNSPLITPGPNPTKRRNDNMIH